MNHDEKTQDWASDQALSIYRSECADHDCYCECSCISEEFAVSTIAEALRQAELRGYERGVREAVQIGERYVDGRLAGLADGARIDETNSKIIGAVEGVITGIRSLLKTKDGEK